MNTILRLALVGGLPFLALLAPAPPHDGPSPRLFTPVSASLADTTPVGGCAALAVGGIGLLARVRRR